MKRLRCASLVAVIATLFTFGAATAASATNYSISYTTLQNLPVLGTSYIRQGNVVVLWQNILYVDNNMNQCVSQSANAIDGYFGSLSRSDTIAWQSKNGLGADGIVGAATWSKVWSKTSSLGYEWLGGERYDFAYNGERLGPGAKFLGYSRWLATGQSSFSGTWSSNSIANPNGGDHIIQWPSITSHTC